MSDVTPLALSSQAPRFPRVTAGVIPPPYARRAAASPCGRSPAASGRGDIATIPDTEEAALDDLRAALTGLIGEFGFLRRPDGGPFLTRARRTVVVGGSVVELT
jgi:hypothetical protein